MKYTWTLASLATVAGIIATTLHVTSDAHIGSLLENPAPTYVAAAKIIEHGQPKRLSVKSEVALVMDDREGVMLYGRNIDMPRPIASLTKLMTALIIIESDLSLDDEIIITREDRDRLRGTRSRLPFGGVFTRYDLLRTALGASDNRAAAALARTYPGGIEALQRDMNKKAAELGMSQSHFVDASGLDNGNVSTARDLSLLVAAAQEHQLFYTLTTTASFRVIDQKSGRKISFHNTNRLVHRDAWDISLSKTGYTAAAGNCLLMQVTIADRPLTIVLLNSWGKHTRYGDANRIHRWLERAERRVPSIQTASMSAE